jgi:hypothetical protein
MKTPNNVLCTQTYQISNYCHEKLCKVPSKNAFFIKQIFISYRANILFILSKNSFFIEQKFIYIEQKSIFYRAFNSHPYINARKKKRCANFMIEVYVFSTKQSKKYSIIKA